MLDLQRREIVAGRSRAATTDGRPSHRATTCNNRTDPKAAPASYLSTGKQRPQDRRFTYLAPPGWEQITRQGNRLQLLDFSI
jgi:hypothetical protein